ncbi:hypothetical protein [Christensenella tenuis]|uniref:Transposase n=1 Tax=Christensenella tenuis TaxID=2763033 RepID=A0ABR7EE62_9FIRM|nr:hypothetical protein [Christensenella tenuis]MBC5648067.1 hypothetical protein [Christensenella tenuis]
MKINPVKIYKGREEYSKQEFAAEKELAIHAASDGVGRERTSRNLPALKRSKFLANTVFGKIKISD